MLDRAFVHISVIDWQFVPVFYCLTFIWYQWLIKFDPSTLLIFYLHISIYNYYLHISIYTFLFTHYYLHISTYTFLFSACTGPFMLNWSNKMHWPLGRFENFPISCCFLTMLKLFCWLQLMTTSDWLLLLMMSFSYWLLMHQVQMFCLLVNFDWLSLEMVNFDWLSVEIVKFDWLSLCRW